MQACRAIRRLGPNNSFKPKPLRYGKGMAGKACHAFASTTRFGLTQALGLMRNILALAVLTLAVSVSAGELPPSELSIGGVVSGATEISVVDLLGEPSRRVETGEGTEFHYPGLVVTVGWIEQQAVGVQRRVVAVRGTGRNACTPRGLCPGMPASEVGRLYGPSEPVKRDYGTFIEYQPADISCWLQVSVPAGIVQSMAVACQP